MVPRGSAQVAAADFRTSTGATVVFNVAPRYTVKAANGATIVSGITVQSQDTASTWRAGFTIPADAPLQAGRWSIIWEGTDTSGNSHRAIEYFLVVDSLAPDAASSDVLLMNGDPFRDVLVVDMPITAASLSIMDSNGTQIYSSGDLTPLPTAERDGNGRIYYRFGPLQIDALALSAVGFNAFFAQWRYTQNAAERVEVHAVYLVGGRTVYFINALRHYLDKARNYDVNPSLRWTDAELVHFVIEGINRINVTEPQMTGWNVQTIPQVLSTLVIKAAAHEALNALYIAEGFSAFDFQSLSVNLQVDRTQFIQTKMDELNTWLEEHIKRAKRLTLRQGSVGHLTVTVGNLTNVPLLPPYNPNYARVMLARASLAR